MEAHHNLRAEMAAPRPHGHGPELEELCGCSLDEGVPAVATAGGRDPASVVALQLTQRDIEISRPP